MKRFNICQAHVNSIFYALENYKSLPDLLNRPGILAGHKLHPKRSFFYLLYSEKKKKNNHSFTEFSFDIVFELPLQCCSLVKREQTELLLIR